VSRQPEKWTWDPPPAKEVGSRHLLLLVLLSLPCLPLWNQTVVDRSISMNAHSFLDLSDTSLLTPQQYQTSEGKRREWGSRYN
jgi:hypothetical protein